MSRSVYFPSKKAGIQKKAERPKPMSIKYKVLSIKYGERLVSVKKRYSAYKAIIGRNMMAIAL